MQAGQEGRDMVAICAQDLSHLCQEYLFAPIIVFLRKQYFRLSAKLFINPPEKAMNRRGPAGEINKGAAKQYYFLDSYLT